MTEKQYRTLCKFRDSLVPALGKPDEATQNLYSRGFIRPKKVEYTQEDECIAFYQKVFWEITTSGKRALSEFEENENNQRKQEAKLKEEQAAKERQITLDSKKQFKREIIVAIIGSAIGGLIVLAVQNWSAVINFLMALFQ